MYSSSLDKERPPILSYTAAGEINNKMPEHVSAISVPLFMDDATLSVLRATYGSGVSQIFDAYEGLCKDVFGDGRNSFTCAQEGGGVSGGRVVDFLAALNGEKPSHESKRLLIKSLTQQYLTVCAAVQVKPCRQVLNCVNAHDVMAWLERKIPSLGIALSAPVVTSALVSSFASSLCSGFCSVRDLMLEDLNALRVTAESDKEAVARRIAEVRAIAIADAEKGLPPPPPLDFLTSSSEQEKKERAEKGASRMTYMNVIERYLFAEERKAEEERRLEVESQRRIEAAVAEAELKAKFPPLSREDAGLLFLAEEDGRRTLVEMFIFELKNDIISPFVSKTLTMVHALRLDSCVLGANGLLATIASLRCCPRLKLLSFVRCGLDTPFTLLLFRGPLRQGFLLQLETLILDENPIGSLAADNLLRLLRASNLPIVADTGSVEGAVRDFDTEEVHKKTPPKSLCVPLSKLSGLSLMGIQCDASVVRKIDRIIEPREAQRKSSQTYVSSLLAAEFSLEPSGRKAISDEASLAFYSIAAKFYC